jgi:parvulin-like peptidyl-prolyl isomerase
MEEVKVRHARIVQRQCWLSLLLVLFSLILCQSLFADEPVADKPVRELLVTVNDDSIHTTNLDAAFGKQHSSMSAADKENFDYRKLLDKLVNDRLIVQEAISIGMAEDSAFAATITYKERDYAVRAFIAAKFAPNDSATQAEILGYFNDNYYTKQVRTVSVATQAEATRLMELVRKGASMDSISRAVSVDIYRYQGGLHRPKFWADIDPTFRKLLPNMKDGDLVGPFPYRQVSAFLRLEKSTPADTTKLSEYESYIKSIVKQQKRAESWRQFTQNFRANYRIKVDSTLLQKLIAQGSVSIDSAFMVGTEQPFIWVDDSVITTDGDFRKKLAHEAMSITTIPFDSITRRVLNEQIDNTILVREAFKAGYGKDASVVRKLSVVRDSLLIESYLRETVVPKIVLNHEEIERYYLEHQNDFREPDEYILKQALFSRKELADSVVALLDDGADFDFVTKKFIEDQLNIIDKDQWISLASYPLQIQSDLANLAIGKTSKSYPTTDGWLVFKVKNRRPGQVKTREEAELPIREIMFQKRFGELMDGVLATLKEHSKVVYHKEAIDRYFGSDTK